ncbi:unnamed protein product [Lepidochelys olivacea]
MEMKQQIIAKGCVTSGSCKVGPLTTNFGNGLTGKLGIACCMGDACRTTTVTGCPRPTPNPMAGAAQPALVCFLLSAMKRSQIVLELRPDASRLLGLKQRNGTVTPVTMKGCATEAVCANETEVSGSFAGVRVDLTLKCKAPGTARGPAGLLIPALAGLLLTQLLS